MLHLLKKYEKIKLKTYPYQSLLNIVKSTLIKKIKEYGSNPDASISYVTVKTAEINKHLAELLIKKEEFKKKLLEEQNK